MAWEALHEYSSSKKDVGYTHLRVSVESMEEPTTPKVFYVSYDNVLQLQNYHVKQNISPRISPLSKQEIYF